MPTIDAVVSVELNPSIRARQVSAMFDAPISEKSIRRWQGDLPIEAIDWSVGLIVGPSGSGKSTILRSVWGDPVSMVWSAKSIIDDIAPNMSTSVVAETLSGVGLNTIPTWVRPFATLSNGERFRAEVARTMCETPDDSVIVLDEFTSVVDRQVAKIASHAVQKYVRKNGRRLVVASCHSDIEDWLQPDWILEPATMTFRRRSLQRRPSVDLEIRPVDSNSTWPIFRDYHYLTGSLHRNAACFAGFCAGEPVVFAAVIYTPVSTGTRRGTAVACVSRLVTLPDWQGLGLAFALVDTIGGAYAARGRRLMVWPAHPSLIRSFNRSPVWALKKLPKHSRKSVSLPSFGGRPNAVFEFMGPSNDDHATALFGQF